MTALAQRRELSLRTPLVWSGLFHLLLVAGLLLGRSRARDATPPTYRVTLIAAPAGPRQVGVVSEVPRSPERMAEPPTPTPAPTTPPPTTPAAATPAPRAPATPKPERMPAPPSRARPAPPTRTATPNAAGAAAKPTPAKADPAPAAGGGPAGGRGADVANVRTEGIEFPYPVYLQNVVRQIALQFKPPPNSALRAEVSFLIRRDGSITGLRLVTRSGSFSFDQDAMGAVEAAARSNAFGPLPPGFTDDVLPVIFSFDPRLIR